MPHLFRTEVEVKKFPLKINHQEQIMMIGSCFTENIGNCLLQSGFRVDLNPFGIVYNPISICKSIKRLLSKELFTFQELFFQNEQWHSYEHHSSFSAVDIDEALSNINKRLEDSAVVIGNAKVLLLTLGSSFVYRLIETDQVVANCHKMPDVHFGRELLTVENIVEEFQNLIRELHLKNPELKIVITISPVRHLKDTAFGNQISKSTLFVAVDRLLKMKNVFYFPAYEIVMDDLRDYRFYAKDMLHPSSEAIEYIWSKFSDAFFNAETVEICRQVKQLKADLAHRPFNTFSEKHKLFIENIKLSRQLLVNKYPFLNLD